MGTVTLTSGVSYSIWGTYSGSGSADEHAAGSLVHAATWTAATVDNRKRALIEATRLLTRQPWNTATQALVDASTPSTVMITAGYELALAALVDASILSTATLAVEPKRLKAGSVEVENFGPGVRLRFPAPVMELIGELLETASTSGIDGSYISGTSDCSDFDDCDRYDVTRGG
jgi:hypothetical protein